MEGRENMDLHPIDEQGKLILSLCKSSALRILNGRTPGDECGSFTWYPSNLIDIPSAIDYALCSEPLIEEVKSFRVLPFNDLSDHCCISLTIKSNIPETEIEPPPPEVAKQKIKHQLISKKRQVRFDKTKEHLYIQALKEDPNIDILQTYIIQPNQSRESMDNIITQVNNILLGAAKKTSLVKKECKASRRILRHHSKKFSEYPFDKKVRNDFVKARNWYKTVCRKAESTARLKLTQKLMNLGQTDPKLFWNTIKEMNNWGGNKHDPTDDIDLDKWIQYFRKLLNDNNSTRHSTGDQLPTFEPTLDSKIKIKELRQALSCLKSGKACGPDDILGEYLKVFGYNFEDMLLRIVNSIFTEKLYPSQWTSNFLKPIKAAPRT